jgi:dTDP-3,4-didehydro-2,6-dideoxy-alpha-D-glucose 3-reductase
MRKIHVGVMGCANIAQRSVIPAIKLIPEFELVAIGSRDLSKAAYFTDRFGGEPLAGYDRLIENPNIEALYIPLPTGLHKEWITKALTAGKHVIAEKSLAMDFTSAKAMVELATRNQLVLMEDFMYRYHSQHNFVFDQLAMGTIGETRLFRSSFGFPPLDTGNFRYDSTLGGGAVLDAAAYTVNVSQWFLGEELQVLSSNLFMDNEKKVDIHGSAMLYHPDSGIVAQIAFGFDNFYQCNYEIWGSKGKITAERAFTPNPNYNPRIIVEKQSIKSEYLMPADNHFVNIFKEFASCIINNEHVKHTNTLLNQSRILTELRGKAMVVNK